MRSRTGDRTRTSAHHVRTAVGGRQISPRQAEVDGRIGLASPHVKADQACVGDHPHSVGCDVEMTLIATLPDLEAQQPLSVFTYRVVPSSAIQSGAPRTETSDAPSPASVTASGGGAALAVASAGWLGRSELPEPSAPLQAVRTDTTRSPVSATSRSGLSAALA